MAKSLKHLSDDDLLVAAFTAAQTNQHQLAIKHFKEAIRRDPADPFAYLEMAKCYFTTDRPEQAGKCLDKVANFANSDAELLLPLAAAYQTVRNYQGAINAMQQAEKIPRLKITALTRQAEIFELSNRLDEAWETIKKTEQENSPPTAAILAIKAKLHRRQGEYPEAKFILENLLAQSENLNPDFKASLRYEMAAVLDKTQNYQAAFQSLTEAKSIHLGTDSYKIAQRGRSGTLTLLSDLCKDLESSAFEKFAHQIAANPSSQANSQPKQAFLLGHPRSGTTLIEQALDAHPDLVSADETAIFHNTVWMPTALNKGKRPDRTLAQDLTSLPQNYLRGLRKDYHAHWLSLMGRDTKHCQVWLDKNPALTTRLAIIARFFPDASIIFALRDPRDVVISSFMQPVGVNDWSINWLTLEETVHYYCFAMQMWLDIREKLKNPWIEVRYEDCVTDLEKQARRATTHLGLQWNDAQADIQKHTKTKLVYSPTYSDVSKPIYSSSVGRWQNYREHLEPYLKQLAPFVQAFGYND